MTDALLARLTYEPASTMKAVPWPPGLAPKPLVYSAGDVTALPSADVVVVTWTAAEWRALADVLTPGRPSTRWLRYARGWSTFEPKLTDRSPARDAGCLGEYWLTVIGQQRVLCFHSQLHLSTDGATAPIVDLWRQIVVEVNPKLVITTGTAGGIGPSCVLGDVFIVNSAKFNCTKTFRDEPWAQQRFTQGAGLAVPSTLQVAQETLVPVNAAALPTDLTPRTPQLWAGVGDVETVDYFGFDDTTDRYGIVANDPQAHTEEMDDATLPLALSQMGGVSVPWLSIRNASDPMVSTSAGNLEAQSKWASAIYEKWGYTTTIGSALACWAIIAGMPTEGS